MFSFSQQSYGLIIEGDYNKTHNFNINPNKRTQLEEDTMKVQFKHLELSFLVYTIVIGSIVIPSIVLEWVYLYATNTVQIWVYKYKEWDRKWKIRHGLW